MENLSKNLADADEYPALMHIHQRCISMLSHLWRIPKGETAIGTATTGSSEAIHLGGMAMKRRWIERRIKEGPNTLLRSGKLIVGKPITKPNVLMGANAQVAIE
jgi:glutamate decarboxylase